MLREVNVFLFASLSLSLFHPVPHTQLYLYLWTLRLEAAGGAPNAQAPQVPPHKQAHSPAAHYMGN